MNDTFGKFKVVVRALTPTDYGCVWCGSKVSVWDVMVEIQNTAGVSVGGTAFLLCTSCGAAEGVLESIHEDFEPGEFRVDVLANQIREIL